MDTDIHAVFQRFDPSSSSWLFVPHEYNTERDYSLFAVLAGVRNGFGFAGVPIFEPLPPISEPRDFPPGFIVENDSTPDLPGPEYITPWHRKYWNEKDDSGNFESRKVWMGDHSHSWLLSEEILNYYKNIKPSIWASGYITREQYKEWDHSSEPSSHSGDIWGGGIVKTTHDDLVKGEAPDNWTHIRVSWADSLTRAHDYFLKEIQRLHDLHGGVRMVFGFDS